MRTRSGTASVASAPRCPRVYETFYSCWSEAMAAVGEQVLADLEGVLWLTSSLAKVLAATLDQGLRRGPRISTDQGWHRPARGDSRQLVTGTAGRGQRL